METPTHKIIERFWRKVDKSGPVPGHRPELGPCWVWIGGSEKVRASFCWNYRTMNAAIFAYRISYDDFDPSLFVCHKCDNKRCVRPDHLFQGTNSQNLQDALSKGIIGGEKAPHAKITNIQAEEIRQKRIAGLGILQLANDYGISYNAVRKILNRETFKYSEKFL